MQNKNQNVVVLCPPCGENVGLPTKRGFLNKETSFTTPLPAYGVLPPQRGQIKARGFTLIELLVVVLIIGILAAVAVPQYQKSIDKSRYARIMSAVRSIANAQEVYYLNNGHYANSKDELDVSIQIDPIRNTVFSISSVAAQADYRSRNKQIVSYTIFYRFAESSLAGKTMCFSFNNDYRERAKKLCMSMGGKYQQQNPQCKNAAPCKYYVLSKK